MGIIHDAVKKIEEIAKNTGCEDGNVVLRVNPDCVTCQYEKGACMEAVFGGRVAQFVTRDPVRATTRMGFMFGATLDSVSKRAAACAILNVITGFLCISRVMKSCPRECHATCLNDLKGEIYGKTIFCKDIPGPVAEKLGHVVTDPEQAEVILMNGAALVSDQGSALIAKYDGSKRILFVAPSNAGVASLQNLEYWCPYGRA
jgi:hypothetical protein